MAGALSEWPVLLLRGSCWNVRTAQLTARTPLLEAAPWLVLYSDPVNNPAHETRAWRAGSCWTTDPGASQLLIRGFLWGLSRIALKMDSL